MDKTQNFDLEERTARFGESVIGFVKRIKTTNINKSLINQLIRSATSIGANYVEADVADSKRDFKHKIVLCKKETLHWLRMLVKTYESLKEECRKLWKESHELVLIFSAIIKSVNKTKRNF